jgi:uncharacterized protein YycO
MSATSTPCKDLEQSFAVQITTQFLLAGDIIATRAHTANSVGVRMATGGTVSHAILYTGVFKGYSYAVDAMPGKGVTRDRLYNKLMPASYAVVFRHRTATPEQCKKTCAWAAHQALMHKPYDYNSAAGVGVIATHTNVSKLIVVADQIDAKANPEGEDASFMCSELVFRAYEIAGAPLTDKPAYCMSPHALFKTDRLACLGRLK